AAAAKPAAGAGAKPATPATGGSPLDKIRAAAKPAAAPAEQPAAAPTAEEAPKSAAPKPAVPMTGSPLDRIRAQGGAKKE
ncbi:MAG TPA: hypothetical protein PLY87_20980, partial [Planctomycetaceae bacterium]|nr:hypothetical protein [Planctomycetaceae bacterium]